VDPRALDFGNGDVVLGTSNFQYAYAWVKEGKGVALWDYARGLTPIGSLEWCKDVPYVSWFGGDLCEELTSEEIKAQVGSPPMEIYDMSDDGSILIGRTGTEVVGGMVGTSFSWLVNMNQVFVCEHLND